MIDMRIQFVPEQFRILGTITETVIRVVMQVANDT